MWWAQLLNQIAAIHGTGVAASTNSYESIASYNGTGSSGVITFSSIPSTYKHLQIRAILRGSSAHTANGTNMNYNSDTGANYTLHRLIGDGASASADGYTARSGAWFGLEVDANASANIYGAAVVDILDYTNTNKYKTSRSMGAYDLNGSGQINYASALWLNTAAITSITITAAFGGNWTTGSSFALYGIKG
jgi:hypothetical protein